MECLIAQAGQDVKEDWPLIFPNRNRNRLLILLSVGAIHESPVRESKPKTKPPGRAPAGALLFVMPTKRRQKAAALAGGIARRVVVATGQQLLLVESL
jgi:hypothetical protein